MVKIPEHEAIKNTWAPAPPTYIIQTLGETREWFHTCHHAQTLEAYSQTYKCTVWIPLPCKQWSCGICAADKIRRLSNKCEDAKPNRLLTLTIDPSLWDSPRASFDGTRRKVPELMRKLRTKFGEVEYLRVTELTKGGWPHYHCLVRSDFLPHESVKQLWSDLTGAIIVDLRRVKDRFQTYTYLVKYLTKMHTLKWTERHVSYSRGFFPPPEPKVDSDLGLAEASIIEAHPGTYLYHQFRHAQLVEIGYGVFTINPPEGLVDEYSDPTSWAIDPKDPEPCPTPTKEATSESTKTTQPKLFETDSTNSKGRSGPRKSLHPN